MRRVDSLEGPFTFGEGSPPTQPEPESKAKPPPSMEVMDSTADGAEPLRSVASNQLLAVHDPSDAKSDSCDDAEAKEAKLEAKEYHGEPGGAGITLGRAIPVSAADAKRRAGAGGHAPMAGAAGAPGGLGSNAMSPRAGGVAPVMGGGMITDDEARAVPRVEAAAARPILMPQSLMPGVPRGVGGGYGGLHTGIARNPHGGVSMVTGGAPGVALRGAPAGVMGPMGLTPYHPAGLAPGGFARPPGVPGPSLVPMGVAGGLPGASPRAPSPRSMNAPTLRARGGGSTAKRGRRGGAGGARGDDSQGDSEEDMDMEGDDGPVELGPDGQPMTDKRRLERNQREQRRSFKISQQIENLRQLLEGAGCSVKANKSSILNETANYIRMLQQRHVQLDLEHRRHFAAMQQSAAAMQQQQHMHGTPPQPRAPLPPQSARVAPPAAAAAAAAAPPGGAGVSLKRPPPSPSRSPETSPVEGEPAGSAPDAVEAELAVAAAAANIPQTDYKLIFRDACVPMAIAAMDGCFIETNCRFCEVSGYLREELLKLTIFNLTAPWELQQTFTMVSAMLRSSEERPCFEARGVTKQGQQRNTLAVSLVRDSAKRPKCVRASARAAVSPVHTVGTLDSRACRRPCRYFSVMCQPNAPQGEATSQPMPVQPKQEDA